MKSLQQRIEKLRNELRFQLKKESTLQYGKTTAPILDIPPEQVNNDILRTIVNREILYLH